jgi:hypothetical protein
MDLVQDGQAASRGPQGLGTGAFSRLSATTLAVRGRSESTGFLESFLMSNAPAPAELRTEFCEILFPYPWLRLSHLEHLD